MPSAWSKSCSNWSGSDKPRGRQAWSMRRSIPRRSRPCTPATTATWWRADDVGSWSRRPSGTEELVSYQFREFDDERRWLRRPPSRRRFLLGLLLVPLPLVWLPRGGPGPSEVGALRSSLPATPTAEQRALEAGRWALVASGRFEVTNHLGPLRGWFWTNGPQYQSLAREARLRRGTKVLPALCHGHRP